MMQFEYMREKQSEIDKLKSKLEWHKTYGEYINKNFPKVDGEACSFADGDEEEIQAIKSLIEGNIAIA